MKESLRTKETHPNPALYPLLMSQKSSYIQAMTAKSLLASHGIASWLQNDVFDCVNTDERSIFS
jgi:hypothetical protein